ncbi:MAG: hypothetical protein NC200_06390 [Candidatus Gastranaerophilales bacterium]|nr:hypothetical protein [Candidatus Gastranaerophilales bacterium]
MNIRTSFKAGMAALAIATAPMTAAAKGVAKDVAADSIRTEHSVVREGNKWVSITRKTNKNTGAFVSECRVSSTQKPAGYRAPGEPAEQEGVFRVGVDYSTREILGQRTHEPRARVKFDGRSEHIAFRPEVAVGTETYSAVVPLDYVSNVGQGASFEAGLDLAGVRGFHNGKQVFLQKDVDKIVAGEDCRAHSYSGEFFNDVHVGARFKNDVVNAGARVEGGFTGLIGGGFIKEAKGSTLSEIQSSGHPIVGKQSSAFVGARADVAVTPFKNNRNIEFNAQGAVSTNKRPEASVGVAYKF